MNASYIQQQAQNYNTALQSYISTQSPNATVGDVLGTKNITFVNAHILHSSLPYDVVALGSRMATLPDNLRWKFTIQVTDNMGNPILTTTTSTPDLAGKTITLMWPFAAKSDAEAWMSYLPTSPSGGLTLPDLGNVSFPGYLINVQPQIAINGVPVSTDGDLTLGSQVTIVEGYTSPANGAQLKTQPLIVGSDHAIGLDLQGISPAQLATLQTQINAAQNAFQSGDTADLNAYNTSGVLLQAGILSYLSTSEYINKLEPWSMGVVQYIQPSFGTFRAAGSITYLYGIPQQVAFPGVIMDVNGFTTSSIAKDGSNQTLVNYNTVFGSEMSNLENVLPEQLFANPDETLNGISAAKALYLANQSGQRIYQITDVNVATVLPQLTVSQSVIDDIQNAVNAGEKVMVSQHPVTNAGWTGAGYVILDPTTGAAAYKINGGANGGYTRTGVAMFGIAGEHTLEAISKFSEVGKAAAFFKDMAPVAERVLPGLAKFLGVVGALAESFNILYKCHFSMDGFIYAIGNLMAQLLLPLIFTGVGIIAMLILGVIFSIAMYFINEFFIDSTCKE